MYNGFTAADPSVAHLPGGIDPREIPPGGHAPGITYQVVKVSGVMRGDRVVIFGIEGLGYLVQQCAQICGGETIAVDDSDERLALARQLGAAHSINAASTDPVAALQALGGADVAVVLTADARVIEQAHAVLRPGGRLILVSLPGDADMSLPVFETMYDAGK